MRAPAFDIAIAAVGVACATATARRNGRNRPSTIIESVSHATTFPHPPIRRLLALISATALAFGASAATAAQAQPGHVSYRVVIDAPSPLASTLEQGLDLVRWQGFDDMTEDLLDRLAQEAIGQTKEVAATEGYFSASVDIAVQRGAAPGVPLILRLTVRPGQPTRITRVNVRVTGKATTDVPDGTAAIAKAQREWLLPAGAAFRQSAWDAAKRKAVATIAASPYAAAAIEKSEARIDPDTHSAELDVAIASGEPFRFGGVDIQGLRRYDLSVVRNFSTIRAGERYSEARLEQFIRRLNTSGYFSSVQARIEPDPARAGDSTIDVRVIEAPPKRLEGGLGFSTDTRVRGNLRYSDVDVDHRASQFFVEARADSKIQNLSARIVRPPNEGGWLDTFGAQMERTDIAGLTTKAISVGVRRRSLEERDLAAYAATYYDDEQRPAGSARQHAHASYVEYGRTWRNVDGLLAPTRGWALETMLGAGPPVVSTRAFGRAIVKFAAWYPLGRADSLEFRAEAGGVLANSRDGIPSALLFRTGGDTSVRGYAFESLGVQQGDAIVGGRYYALASVEAAHYFTPVWGIAAFVDAGNAGDDLRLFRAVYGYGTGLRVRSPIGPVRVDVAYGQATQQVRFHMSVGVSF